MTAFRLPVAAVAAAVAADRAAGLTPFAVVAHRGDDEHGRDRPAGRSSPTCARRRGCGSTSTAPTGRRRRLTDRAARRWRAWSRADSLVIDPHKWLFQPYEAGAVLVREPGLLERTFTLERRVPARHVRRRGQLPRPRDPAHARHARAEAVAERPGVRARRVPRGGRARDRARRARRGGAARAAGLGGRDAGVARASSASPAWATTTRACRPRRCCDGYAAPSTTVLRGETVLRLCTINPRTTFEEIEETIERMERV